jgi:hypothetical protein
LAGYTFLEFPKDAIADPRLRLAVGLMAALAPVSTMLVLLAIGPSAHHFGLARRIQAESKSPSVRVGLILYPGSGHVADDEGIVTFNEGILTFTGALTSFRIGRGTMEEVIVGCSDKRCEVTFREEGELRRIAFEDKTQVPLFQVQDELKRRLRNWFDHAPPDRTLDSPPGKMPPSPVLGLIKTLAVWTLAYMAIRFQLHRFPAGSAELASFILAFLVSLGFAFVVSLVQAMVLLRRVASEPLSVLLQRPQPTPAIKPALDSAAVNIDATPRQKTSG